MQQIRDKEIRLIGADGAQMGIMSPRDALKMAIDKDLDLVKVSAAGQAAGVQNSRLR